MSGLNFISKLIEKIVANQVKEHMSTFNLDNPYQSAYKKDHSTESTLLSVQNDILLSMDMGKVTALVLLDLSGAFDTISHDHMLLDRLSKWFGFCDGVFRWFVDYLGGHSQKIKLEGHLSNNFQLLYGVPQGSVLGPLLFSMYTSPLSFLFKNFSISHRLYADNTQIYFCRRQR